MLTRRGFLGSLAAASMLAMVRFVPVPQLRRGPVVIEGLTLQVGETLVVPRGAIVRKCVFYTNASWACRRYANGAEECSCVVNDDTEEPVGEMTIVTDCTFHFRGRMPFEPAWFEHEPIGHPPITYPLHEVQVACIAPPR